MFSFAFAVSGFLMIGFSPIAIIISKLYGCSLISVNVQILIYVILFIPANFLVINLMKKYNLRAILVMGSLLLFVAGWLRQLVQVFDNFEYVVTVGNIFGAFAQPFFGNCTSKLASTWFGDKERALSTALGTLAMPIGCILGQIVPVAII